MNSPGLSLAQFTQLWMCINAGPVHSAVNIIIGPVHSAVNDWYCWPFTGPIHSAVNIITGPVHSAMNIISGPVTQLWMSVIAGLLLAQFTQVWISSLAQYSQLNDCYCWLFTGPVHSAVNIITGPVTQVWMSVIAGLLLAQFTQVWVSSLAQFTQLWISSLAQFTLLWMIVIAGCSLAQFTQLWISIIAGLLLAHFTQLWTSTRLAVNDDHHWPFSGPVHSAVNKYPPCSEWQSPLAFFWPSSLSCEQVPTLQWMTITTGLSLTQLTQLWMSTRLAVNDSHHWPFAGPVHSAVNEYNCWPFAGLVHSAVNKYRLWPPHNGPVHSAVSALSKPHFPAPLWWKNVVNGCLEFAVSEHPPWPPAAQFNQLWPSVYELLQMPTSFSGCPMNLLKTNC